ncbi:MAG: lipopolysaccharide heptosyltransferase II [Deltaproteobacteria bacterium]|nr:lipopolysaccharide heptosyltransferase II [Deltaproteobacteria bacterium]
MDKGFKKILVRAPNWIGDAVMSLPALSALKALYPASEISVLAKARVAPVYFNNPDVSAVIVYDDAGRHKGLLGRFNLASEIKEKGFDAAVLFQNAFDAAFLSFIAGIPARVGYARDFRRRLLTLPIDVTPEIKTRHQIQYYLNIVVAMGGHAPSPSIPAVYLSAEEEQWAKGFLKENSLEGRVLVGAAPGASYGQAKRWAPAHFAAALTGLSLGYGAVSLIFGSSVDKAECEAVSSLIKTQRINLCARLTLRQFMSLLAHLRVFITNDSGPMHLSAAVGGATVAIFGSTDPALTGPVGEKAAVVIKKIVCSPCFDRVCRYGHYKCLSGISAAEVMDAAGVYISKGAA